MNDKIRAAFESKLNDGAQLRLGALSGVILLLNDQGVRACDMALSLLDEVIMLMLNDVANAKDLQGEEVLKVFKEFRDAVQATSPEDFKSFVALRLKANDEAVSNHGHSVH